MLVLVVLVVLLLLVLRLLAVVVVVVLVLGMLIVLILLVLAVTKPEAEDEGEDTDVVVDMGVVGVVSPPPWARTGADSDDVKVDGAVTEAIDVVEWLVVEVLMPLEAAAAAAAIEAA